MRNFVLIFAGWMLLCTQSASAALPDLLTTTAAIRSWVASKAPVATAAQAREFGLILPDKIDLNRPLVVLVHGLDMEQSDWGCTADLLKSAGQQVAWFNYPQDQPIDDDVKLLADRLLVLHRDCPAIKLNLVAYSMGSLVCRGYIEGACYTGGVDRLIMLAPPNHGSIWAEFGIAAKCREQINQYRHDENWRPSWIVTSGLCEADCDLLPGSDFLIALNALPRRTGVRYSIVEGDEHVVRRITADCVAAPAKWVPQFADNWWGVRQARTELAVASIAIQTPVDRGDGPVRLDSAELDGVSDVVRVHGDHATMIQSHHGEPPMAWPAIKARLVN